MYIIFKNLIKGSNDRVVSVHSVLTILSIVLSVAILITVMSVMEGFRKELTKRFIGIGSDVQIEKFRPERNRDKTMSILDQMESVDIVSPYVFGSAICHYGSNSHLFTVMGVTPSEWDATTLRDYLLNGDLDISGNRIVIGEGLANRFGLSIGDGVRLISPSTYQANEFLVSTIFKTDIHLYDNNLVYMSLEAAQVFYDIKHITGYKVKTRADASVLQSKLMEVLGAGYEVKTWLDNNRAFIGALEIERKMMILILSTLVILSGFSITSTLVMSVLGKRKEISILKSFGVSKQQIWALFLAQGASLAVIGIIGGVVLGVALSLNINFLMSLVSRVFEIQLLPDQFYYLSKIPVQIEVGAILAIVVFCLGVSLLASVYPARRAANLDPVEIFRNG